MKVALFAAVHYTDEDVEIHIPDLELVQRGSTYVEAAASAYRTIEAIHEYNAKRGISQIITKTYDDVLALCTTPEDFPTVLSLKE